MLKSWGIKDSRYLTRLPALINCVGGEVASLPGSAVSPLLLTGPEQATGSETKQEQSPGPFQSICSPPSHLNRGPSPSRQPLYLTMDLPEQRPTADSRQTSWALEKYEPRSMMVAVDATRELQLAPLKYALENFVRPGDKLCLLGILHQLMNPMGYKQKACSDPTEFNGTNKHKIQEEIRKKTGEFERGLQNDPELQNLINAKQVVPTVQIAAEGDRKVVTVQWALELRATWVVLDNRFKRDKGYLREKLNCNLVLMRPKNNGATFIGVELPENSNFSAGPYQLPLDKSTDLDKSIDLPPMNDPTHQSEDWPRTELYASIAQAVSDRFNAISELSPGSVSSSSLQHVEMKISTQPTEEHKLLERQFPAMPELSSTKLSLMQVSNGEDQLMAAESDQHLKSELGQAGTFLERENVHSEPEDDTSSSSSMMVGSVGSTPSDAFYKIAGRPSMSTGDLQSLEPKSSAATLYRPAPRSASDRTVDELMNILSNPPASTPPAAETPTSIRTLQRSLRDEDLYAQLPNPNNGPVGRLTKFGSENEENRLLLDNSAHGRRKNPRPVAPLCSYCHKPGPVFGSDAIKFTYADLEKATDNFDQENYLAEGGYGFVYKGRLEGGQEIAVKQYKAASSQGDDEFYSEVDVLKHAQHRNLVILIGYCIEHQKRLLVYEFVCNKSLDVHLSAKNVNVLEWKWRWKVAVGAARGLRYLHEECRVGCIVHRDMRPNNILLTHDFVPMVGDFGLARSQPSGADAEETRVIGTLGYLAPEYAESGSITEKADVYSFGVVLLELITGRKAIDTTKARGETCLTEWARPMILAGNFRDIVDPRLGDAYDVEQVDKMVDTAGRCISKDKDQRPRMSEVLRLLERDTNSDCSLSRGNSQNDLSEIGRIPRLVRKSGKGIPERQGSLDSVSLKGHGASSIGSVHVSKSTPMSIPSTRLKLSKLETTGRSSSPRSSSSKASSNSPSGKSVLNAKSKSKPKVLSYDDML